MGDASHSDPPTILLLARDLKAAARVEAACRERGAELVRTSTGALEPLLARVRPALVLADLDEGRAGILDLLAAAVRDGRVAPGRALGYFSHVDEALGRMAEEAGIRALPRGRFWRELPELITAATSPGDA